MKLYYAPGACSVAPHVLAREAGLDLELVKVRLGPEPRTADGRDYREITPRGAVPALELDDGEVMTENAVVLQYLSSLVDYRFGPPRAGMERWRFLELLNFVATELHKGFGPLFDPTLPPEARQSVVERLGQRFDLIEPRLERQPYLTGEAFTIVDAYAFAVLRWTKQHRIDTAPWPNIEAFLARVAARPAARQALAEEGLAK